MKITFRKSTLEAIEKAFGKKNLSKLHKEVVTNKNGKRTTVWKKNGETDEKKQKQKQGEEQQETNSFAGSVAEGDKITFTNKGVEVKDATVIGKGKDGVTADAKGIRYTLPWSDIKSVDKKSNDEDAIRNLMDKQSIKQGWRDGTNGLQPESCDTINGLLKSVQEVREEFSHKSENILEQFRELNPKLFKRPSLKDPVRMKEKLREDSKSEPNKEIANKIYDKKTDTYHARTLRDVDGHTFVVNNLGDVAKLLKHFDKQKDVIRIKNNFANPSSVGYSDINMNIRLSNGTIAEIQLNTIPNIVAKEKYGHALYEVYRSIKSNLEYKELANIMAEGQKKLYGMANELSKNGKFPDIGSKNPLFEVEYKPYGDAINPFVQQAKPLFEKAKKAGVLNEKTIKHFEHLLK